MQSDLATTTTFYSWLGGQQRLVETATTQEAITAVGNTLDAYKTCLNRLIGSASTSVSTNSNLLQDIVTLNKKVQQSVLDVQISQDRALLVRHPELSRSYYDGMLSLGRPMSHYSVPILIGISTFLLSISMFMFLNILRVDSRLTLLVPAFVQASNGFSSPFWIMTGIAVILLGLTIYAFTK
jgi:hypothetical protein